jgi:uncharacterized membrane protein YkoI
MNMALKNKVHKALAIGTICLAGIGTSPPATASSGDHQRATQAVESGEILSLRVILERLESSNPGQVLEVELEQKKGVWIYELKILKTGGRLQKLKVDAKTGTVLSDKER